MICGAWWLTFLSALLCLWEETGQNPALFGCRLGAGACSGLVTKTRVLVSLGKRTNFDGIRKRFACSTPSSISSTHYSTLKDSRN